MRSTELLAVVFGLAAALLVWPLLTVANRATLVLGIPALVLYLFAIWATIVLVLMWAARRPSDEDPP